MRTTPLSLTSLAAAALLAVAPATLAKGGGKDGRDTLVRAKCSGSTTAKLKLSPENGRIEAEFEVDQNRNGQRWSWTMGGVSGTAVTKAPSGSFEVRRLLRNGAGPDTVVATARNASSGETCRVSAVARF